MSTIIEQLKILLTDTSYQIYAVILLTAIVHIIIKMILVVMARSSKYTQNEYDDVIIEAISPPISLFTWLVGLSIAVEVFEGDEELPWLDFATVILQTGVVILVGWAFVRVIRAVEEKSIEVLINKNRFVTDGTLSAFAKLLRVVVIVSVSLIVMQTLGFSISGLLAFGGIGGLAIGFAAQDLLSNFFGGLMIHLDRPFSVGDWVRSPDQNIEGTVEKIGWRMTTIRTFDKRPLYVPNATFSNISVENPSRMSNRRIKETIGVRYDDAAQLRAILEETREYLLSNEHIDTKQTLMVNFNSFGASSLDFFIYCFTRTTVWTTYHSIKEDVLLDIMDIIVKHGADIAYPTQRLSIEMNNENTAQEIEAKV